MPETYPEIAPECDVLEYSDSLDPADCVNIEKFIRETCEDQLGEIMCFTIIRYIQLVLIRIPSSYVIQMVNSYL